MNQVVLRQISDKDGTRYLSAKLAEGGDIVIEGQDLGDGVQRIFGVREYEWVWTIRSANVSKVRDLLGGQEDVIAAIADRFSGSNAASLWTFLEDNSVPMEVWSRKGD